VPVVAAAAASGVPARPAARPDMQAFAPSPAASFTASNAVAPFTSSPSVNAVQPFIASPDPAPASFQRPVHSTAAGISQPTFLSEFPDEFDGGEDEPARSSATVAVAAPAPAAWTSAAAAPAASTASSSAKAPWMTAVRADDDVAVVEDFDDDEEIYGRPQQKQGTAVIAPGSVSNARAALTGAGFFLSPQHAAGHTPSMAALKSARAARMGEDTPTAVAEESESLTSPITSTKASSKPKPAAARRSRTIQSFVLTPKSDL
jgi:hypothetical protein